MNKSFSIFYLKKSDEFLWCKKPEKSFVYYRDFRINLLNGKKEEFPIRKFLRQLEQFKVKENPEYPLVYHLFFEFGYLLQGLDDLVPANKVLAITISYGQYQMIKDLPFKGEAEVNLELKDYPKFKNYKKRFDKVYRHLIDGDCYQVNLTSQFYFRFKDQTAAPDVISSLWKKRSLIGQMAHCSYLDSMDRLLISNTPECLFQIKREGENRFKVASMPIKGTVECLHDKDIPQKWKELSGSTKEQAELFMITDLIRNDLAKINSTAAIVKHQKLPLRVPGILHQYSVVESKLDSDVSLYSLLKGVFPGGSITGAPKKRVMAIINQIEESYRSFYCGSTLLFHKSLKAGSINIRSAEVDFTTQELVYGAGGGITLESSNRAEFEESYLKMESFLKLMGCLS